MFKNGECAEMTERQGAAAYIGGTGTYFPRKGNSMSGVHLPVAFYPRSHASSNNLGLNNDGDEANSRRAGEIVSALRIPVIWSVAAPPELSGREQLDCLGKSLGLYQQAGVHALEINESCPNTEDGERNFEGRLGYVQRHFLDERSRNLPVVVKFSNDTPVERVPYIMDMLLDKGFDGVNFGNTTVRYAEMRGKIHPSERKLYDYYVGTFGGGVGGRPLAEDSLGLCAEAARYVKAGPPSHEFHVIRTGGVRTAVDVRASEAAGASLVQMFTGYFENFGEHGHDLYRKLHEKLG
jgi:dihydroorotate dehydrogenase